MQCAGVYAELGRLGIPGDLLHSSWLQAAWSACNGQFDRILAQLVAADLIESCRPTLPSDLRSVSIIPGDCPKPDGFLLAILKLWLLGPVLLQIIDAVGNIISNF
jgi:hypothetical protein